MSFAGISGMSTKTMNQATNNMIQGPVANRANSGLGMSGAVGGLPDVEERELKSQLDRPKMLPP